MHDRVSFVSLKQHLQWKLPSVPRPPEHPPFPCRSSASLDGHGEQDNIQNSQRRHLPRTWGNPSKLGPGCPTRASHLPAPEQPCLACCRLQAARGSLCSTAAEPPRPPRLAVPRFPSSPACNESAEGPWGRQGKSSSAVKIILNKKIAGLINGSVSPRPRCLCFAELTGVSRRRGETPG